MNKYINLTFVNTMTVSANAISVQTRLFKVEFFC